MYVVLMVNIVLTYHTAMLLIY